MKTFESALEMAKWISTNVSDECIQEKLMHQGILRHKLLGKYSIIW